MPQRKKRLQGMGKKKELIKKAAKIYAATTLAGLLANGAIFAIAHKFGH